MAPVVPLSLTKLPRSLLLESTPTSLKYSSAGPYPVFSGAKNQRAVRPPSQRCWPLNLRSPESHLCLPVPAMAGLAQQPPGFLGLHPTSLLQALSGTCWQRSLTPSAPPEPTVRRMEAAPLSDPSQLAPIWTWWRWGLEKEQHSRGAAEERSHGLLPPPTTHAPGPHSQAVTRVSQHSQ